MLYRTKVNESFNGTIDDTIGGQTQDGVQMTFTDTHRLQLDRS